MIYGTPSAFVKPRQRDGMAVVKRSRPRPHRRRRCLRRCSSPWELAISQDDGLAPS